MIQSLKSCFLNSRNRMVHVLAVAIREFRNDRCDLRASALTLYTLLSIVPVMAMAFGIAKGFGFREFLEGRILDLFSGQEQILHPLLSFSNNLLEKTKGGLMAVIGVLLLIYSLIKLMGHIENAFNQIGCVARDRTLVRKFTDYIAISIAAGFLAVVSSSANIFITTYLESFLSLIHLPGDLERLVSLCIKVFAVFATWLLFVFFLVFIPNRKVDIRAAVVGGVVSGTLYQIVQMAYFTFQINVSSYNAIYGSFAALPLFLIWLQASWLIFLLGAEIAFSWENVQDPESADMTDAAISIRTEQLLILRIVHFCLARFVAGETPPSDKTIASEIHIPLKITRNLLSELLACRLLLEVCADGVGYVPARETTSLTVLDVMEIYEKGAAGIHGICARPEFKTFESCFADFEKACRSSSGDKKIKAV